MARQTRDLYQESRTTMDPQIISWIVSLVAGGAGGNIIGALVKNRNLGPVLAIRQKAPHADPGHKRAFSVTLGNLDIGPAKAPCAVRPFPAE